jgi:hypothetical protein
MRLENTQARPSAPHPPVSMKHLGPDRAANGIMIME